jgi:hypothetical protein
MRAVGIGLVVEEQRADVFAAWKRAVDEELGGEAALAFAVGPMLREMGLALRSEGAPAPVPARAGDGSVRSVVLVRSGSAPARVAREFKLLHRALWESVRAAGRIVGADERRAADEWLDEALAAALDRLDRVRARIDLLERPPVTVAPPQQRPPPLPQRPPPLPSARSHAVAAPAFPSLVAPE